MDTRESIMASDGRGDRELNTDSGSLLDDFSVLVFELVFDKLTGMENLRTHVSASLNAS